MPGPAAAAAAVVDRLTTDLPARLDALVDRLGPVDLDAPRLIDASERERIEPEQWPAVLVVAQDEGSVRAVDVIDGAALYAVRYRVRCFSYVRGRSYETTSAARYRLSLGVRESLIGSPVLGPDHTVDASGWTASYSEVAGGERAKRVVAASWVEVMVAAEESVPLAPLATVATTRLTERSSGHPAL